MMTVTDEGQPKAATVLVSMPLPCNGAGVSYTCTSIVRSFNQSNLGVSIFTPYGHAGVKASTRLTETMPAALRTPAVLAHQEAGDQAERAFLSRRA